MSEQKHQCDNCGAVRDKEDLAEIRDYWERVEPGGIVPSGQCPNPDCRALCYPVQPERHKPHTIVVTVQGGLIQAIDDIPKDFRVRVLDFDLESYGEDNESAEVVNDLGERAHVSDWDGPTAPGQCTLKD